MILEKLGIFGWKEADENLLLASLLTGDPLLLIGNHGCAKTHVAHKIAQALGRRFLAYDASKAMFEDILGYPNVQKLQAGEVEYVPSPVTMWDKELILIDELSRANESLQSKWLECIRSRKIMGFATQVKWVWAAMNPVSYAGANTLDEALIGRFALFLYPPDVLQMEESDRIRVATHINGDDAPALREWSESDQVRTVPMAEVQEVGRMLERLLRLAGAHFLRLRHELATLPEFLAKFACLLVRETGGKLALDGRRLGFLHRNILANRAVELAKAELLRTALPDFAASARCTLQASVPVGLNGVHIDREEAEHKLEICFDLLSGYFQRDSELAQVNLVYELFTTGDLLRKAELLLTYDLGVLAQSKAWTGLMAEKRDITLLAYTALQVETRRPGTIPQELLATLSSKVDTMQLSTGCIGELIQENVEYVEDVEALLDRDSDLARLIAYQHVSRMVEHGQITAQRIEEARRLIESDIHKFEGMLIGPTQKGAIAA